MAIRWLAVATVGLGLCDCTPREPPSGAVPVATAAKPAPAGTEKPAERPPPAAIGKAALPAKKPAVPRVYDFFHLPLQIVMEAPEVPPEIVGPSPPIKEGPPTP